MARPTVTSLLDSLLLPVGFRRPPRGSSYTRLEGGLRQVVGIRKSRSGDCRCAVHFSAEFSPPAVADSFELSPVASLKNTYWWPAELLDDEAVALRRQIEGVALAYFRADPSLFDEAAAQIRMHDSLSALASANLPFARAGDTYWRRRGGVIDIVDVEFLAHKRFAYVYVSVWHDALESGAEPQTPEEVTRVASHSVGRGTIDGEPNATLFYLGPLDEPAEAVEQAEIGPTCLAYFQVIVSKEDVLGQIRPEYRHHFPSSGSAG
jgi:hypothetical protein